MAGLIGDGCDEEEMRNVGGGFRSLGGWESASW